MIEPKDPELKRVLIITYYWPPSGGSGVQRWLKFVKYLPQCGWQPVVVVPQNADYPIFDSSLENEIPKEAEVIHIPIWEPYSLYNRFLGKQASEKVKPAFFADKSRLTWKQNLGVWIRGNFFIPDPRIFWVNPVVKHLTKYLKNNPVDVIVTTGPPHSVHLIGKKVKLRTGIPWVADFRDPWTQIYYFEDLQLSSIAKRKQFKLEKEVTTQADTVIVVSPGMEEDFKSRMGVQSKVIYNGYDEDDYTGLLNQVPESEKFVVSFIGTFLTHINYPMLWKALSELVNEHSDFNKRLLIRLVGTVDDQVFKDIQLAGLKEKLEYVPQVDHSQVMYYQKDASLLLVLIAKSHNWEGITSGKLFECLAVKRPILCLGPENGSAAEILNVSGSGRCIHPDDKIKIKDAIIAEFTRFLGGEPNISSREISIYSRKSLTKEIATVFNRLIRKN